MRAVGLIALCLVLLAMPNPQGSRQPSRTVVKKQGSPNGKLATNSLGDKQSPDTEVLKEILGVITKEQQESASNQKQEAASEKESVRVEWWLVGVGIAQAVALVLTFIAIWHQAEKTAESAKATRESAEATKKSAEATEKSVRLQEILQQQWVDIGNWSANAVDFHGQKETLFNIGFDIINPTAVPLILEGGHINIAGERHDFSARNIISPRNSYRVIRTVLLGAEHTALFINNKLVLIINGYVSYVDAFEKPREQPFSRTCRCGPQGATFDNSWSVEYREQNPNQGTTD
jgi:hypothetical protein